MPQTFDLILKGGIVVNQDGRARARHRHPRRHDRRHRRPVAGLRRARRSIAGACTSCRASSTRRCISASPASTTRRIWRPAPAPPCMGGVTAVFEMPNTNPQTTTPEALADKVRARPPPHALRLRLLGRRHARECRATCRSWSACRALPASRCSWARPPARCWSRTTKASPTSCAAPAAAPPSIPRTSRCCASASDLRVEGDPSLASGLARRRGGARPARSGSCASRARPARASTCCMSRRREEMALPRRTTRTSRRVEVTPHHLTLVGAGRLRAPRHLRPDEPAGARRGAPRRRSGRGSTRASPTFSAPTTRRIRARRRTRPIPTRRPA